MISKLGIDKILILKIVLVFAALSLVFGGVLMSVGKPLYPELSFLKRQNLQFEDLQSFFKKLANKRGAQYAFDALRVAPLPPNTDIHLLAHAIGDILYKQKGITGVNVCTQEFRNACSHSVVIGIFVDRGMQALSDIADVCRKAPGGRGAYGMCFHGLGHGILAYTGYDMEKAVSMCAKTGTQEMNYVETSECVSGVVMEMVAGVHDRQAWESQKSKYLKNDDPLYPCNQTFIPAIAKPNCFLYITPHLWEVAGGNLGTPTEQDFAKSFKYCLLLKGYQEVYRDMCFEGFGKEFVGLAQARDIRKVSEMSKDQLTQIYKWCLLAGENSGINACIRQAANSLYWGGENKPGVAVDFCSIMDEGFRGQCYSHIAGAFKFYNFSNKNNLERACKLLPADYSNECLNTEAKKSNVKI